ncbi:hypothetical protein WMF30_04440 [Sorangium sp. So ce134]
MGSRAPVSDRGRAAAPIALALAGVAAGLFFWLGRGALPRPPSAGGPERAAPSAGAAQGGRSAPEHEVAGGPRSAIEGVVPARGPSPAREPERLSRTVPARGLSPAREPERLPDGDRGAAAYAKALAAGDERPGEEAFRADAEAFFEHNLEMAEEKAAREGLTLAELQELTTMGALAMHLQRWEAVEQVLGRELSAETRELAEKRIFSASDELKAAIRRQVAAGEPVAARWATIREVEARFLDEYRAITGLSPAQYDALLALPYTTDQGGAGR